MNHASESRSDQNIIRLRPIDDLLLDPDNPRISARPFATQGQLLQVLFETQALDELALSFARNGFFPEEPLVIVPSPENQTQYIVVEGNRRAATIKILLNAQLQRELGAVEWPSLTSERATQLRDIPTVLYPTRDEVVPYLGYRHITGIKKWEPFAKARYVAQLVERGRTLSSIEQSVGDNANAVRRMYQSYVVFKQAREDLAMDTKPIEATFSLLEVALTQAAIKRFVHLPRHLPTGATERLVPDEALDKLQELLGWIFGDTHKRQERIITDSRQISNRLAPIVADSDALSYLRQTRDLEGAYEFSGGERNVLLRHIQATKRSAQRCIGLLPAYESDAEVQAELRVLRPFLERLLLPLTNV